MSKDMTHGSWQRIQRIQREVREHCKSKHMSALSCVFSAQNWHDWNDVNNVNMRNESPSQLSLRKRLVWNAFKVALAVWALPCAQRPVGLAAPRDDNVRSEMCPVERWNGDQWRQSATCHQMCHGPLPKPCLNDSNDSAVATSPLELSLN